MWTGIEDFLDKTRASWVFEARRQARILDLAYTMVEEHLRSSFLIMRGAGVFAPSLVGRWWKVICLLLSPLVN